MSKVLKNGKQLCNKRSKMLGTNGQIGFLMQETLDCLNAEEGTLQSVFKEECCLVHNIYKGFKENKVRIFNKYSPTIRTPKGGGHLPSILKKNGELSSLNPLEVEKIMGFPLGWTNLDHLETQFVHKFHTTSDKS